MTRRLALILSVALASGAVGAWAPSLWSSDTLKPVDDLSMEQRQAVSMARSFSDGFVAVAGLVGPSVVTITSETMVEPAANPLGNDFFRQFFGDVPGMQQQQRPQRQRGLGSGVIVGSDGVILTNNHVIRGADELTVTLADGTSFDATVVGTDPQSDLAVLRVDADGDLPAVSFGDSDALNVGEWVLAVGSPYSANLEHTFTAGIVSGLGRNTGMRLNDYEYFIQTDAAINPGNSGGALVNLDGEVVGINTAIVSRAGGSNGIGFAIPANQAVEVMDALIADGRVSRGWLGVSIQNVTPEMADALDLASTEGILVNNVFEDSPAGDAGMKVQDIITAVNGKSVGTVAELRMEIARGKPGSVAKVAVQRDGRSRMIDVTLGEYPENGAPIAGRTDDSSPDDLGLRVEPITPDLERRFQLEDVEGVVVTGVTPGGPADDAGLQPGDVIVKVNRIRVASVDDYRGALDEGRAGKATALLVDRAGNRFFVAVEPSE